MRVPVLIGLLASAIFAGDAVALNFDDIAARAKDLARKPYRSEERRHRPSSAHSPTISIATSASGPIARCGERRICRSS